jgi:cupin fold WbuC family metalloprotein
VQTIDRALFEAIAQKAEASPRRRMNHNFHASNEENPHRFLNVLLEGTYVRPHRHLDPPKSEAFLVLDGKAALICFDSSGRVVSSVVMGPNAGCAALGVDLEPGIFHTVVALSDRAVCYEVKPGPWNPATDKDFAPWAPAEGTAEAGSYLAELVASLQTT